MSTFCKFVGILALVFSFTPKLSLIFGEPSVNSLNYEQPDRNFSGYKVYRLVTNSMEGFKTLKKLFDEEIFDFWQKPNPSGNADVMVNEREEINLKKIIKAHTAAINYSVIIDSVEKLISTQNSNKFDRFKTASEMNWNEYHYPETIFDWMKSLGKKYPKIATFRTIGKSVEGNPLNLIQISDPGTDSSFKRAIFIDATTHAREWITTGVATYIINELVTKSKKYSGLFEHFDFYILPIVNPDGYIHSCYYNRLWRKTRKRSDTLMGKLLGCPGVDLNRNFGYGWGGPGSGSTLCSPVYRGTHAFSEPESAAIRKFILDHAEAKWTAYFNLHSYGQKWLTPWGYTVERPDDYDELIRVGRIGANALRAVHGTEFTVGNSGETLYLAAGGSDDWFKGTVGCKYSYTLELRDSGFFGFLLPSWQIIPTSEETWAGIQAAIKAIIVSKFYN